MADETPQIPRLPLPLRKQAAVRAAWKALLANWLLPGAGYWIIGERRRAQAFFAVWAVFLVLAWFQLTHGSPQGLRGGVFVPQLNPIQWLPTLGALGTLGAGPLYGLFAWSFGGAGTEPVRTLTQEYGASYLMVAGLLNWLCIFDLWDRTTGRWVWRLPRDEQQALADTRGPAPSES
ncbi:MAG: hypothetical protein HY823_12905 [Acidobacteria bacterium]|nr:hypothetical protein [Acidobacteriota bacterium]